MIKDIEPRVGLYANYYGYSDVYPHEIIKVNTAKTITIRSMKYERDPDWKPEIIPGGFAGHCVNQSTQKWIITSDPNGSVQKIRLSSRGWSKGRFHVEDAPNYYYDYNF